MDCFATDNDALKNHSMIIHYIYTYATTAAYNFCLENIFKLAQEVMFVIKKRCVRRCHWHLRNMRSCVCFIFRSYGLLFAREAG